MFEKIKTFLKKVWNLVPAVFGVIQVLLPLLKELVMVIVRIIDVFIWDSSEAIIVKVNEIYDVIYTWTEKIKNALLFFK